MIDSSSRRKRGALGAALVALALASCAPTVDQRGNLPDEKALADIKPGVTDKETVTRLLGSPSAVATFDTDTWYYISQKSEELAFFKPTVLDQQVLAIDFDKGGMVRDVRHRGFDDRHLVTPNDRATPAPGREFSFVEQLIGNFGRFNSSGTTPGSTHQ